LLPEVAAHRAYETDPLFAPFKFLHWKEALAEQARVVIETSTKCLFESDACRETMLCQWRRERCKPRVIDWKLILTNKGLLPEQRFERFYQDFAGKPFLWARGRE